MIASKQSEANSSRAAASQDARRRLGRGHPAYNGTVNDHEDDRSRAGSRRSSIDAIIDLYKKDVDRTLLRQALRLSPDQRLRRLVELTRFTDAFREAGKKALRKG